MRMKNIKYYLPSPEKTNYIIILVFIVLSLLLLLNHEPWRDEAQSWLLTRDSPDIASLLHLTSYGAAMPVWHLIVFPFAKSGLPYFSISVVHFLLILAAIVVFIKYAPLLKYQKILFIFGYYPLYEYNTIARKYVLVVLFLFLIAALYKDRFRKPILYSILILLLANTSVHSLVIAITLSGVYIFELKSQRNYSFTKKHIASLLIIILGFSVAIYQLWPPPDLNPMTARWNLDLTTRHIAKIPNAVVGAFLPIPQLKVDFWNTKLAYDFVKYRPVWGLPLFLLSLGFFIRKPKPMFIYLLSSVGIFSIIFLKYSGYLRHHGLIFIIFIFSLWVANEYEERSLIKSRVINRLFNKNNLTYLLSILLFLQITASSVAFYYEMNYDFSSGKKTAAFLKKNGFINNDTFIATYWSPRLLAILPYIPKPYSKFYSIGLEDYRSYVIWNKEYYSSKDLSIDEVVDRVDNAIQNKGYSRVLLILDKKIEDKKEESESKKEFTEKYNLIAHFDKTIVDDESFYIYQLVY